MIKDLNSFDTFNSLHHYKEACADSGKPTRGGLRLQLHKLHASHHTAACFTFATFNSGHPLYTNCYQFTKGWMVWLAVPAPGFEPRRV
jgi:hypothetical protein